MPKRKQSTKSEIPTPAPWSVRNQYWVVGPDGAFICKTEYADGLAAESREANARLIAAAPEMFAALLDAESSHDSEWGCTCDNDPSDLCGLCRIRAALRKAGWGR